MKNNLILIFILFIIGNVQSQTEEEKKKIVSEYNQSEIELLKKQIEEKNKQNQKEIDSYILKNKIAREYTNSEGVLFEIKNIYDGKPVYISTTAASEAIATRTNFLHNGGGLNLNLEGQNMHIATWDGGPTLSIHQEFLNDDPNPTSRVTTPDSSASNSQSDHSSHVSGIIIAKGTQANAKGMAPQATLTSFDWDFADLEALDQATNNGLLLSNHSYGTPVSVDGVQTPTWFMGSYSSTAAVWDNVAFNAPYYLMVVAAGNDGSTNYTGGLANNYDKLTGFGVSKNNLVVANANNPLINPNGSGELLSLFINTSSSQGPSDDGRIKPDISGDGTNVFSCLSTSFTSYGNSTGTSMSTPNVAGSLLLIQQYYNQLNSSFMKSSTLKGLVCHTADDDSSAPGPDAIFGWGLLNAKSCVETIQDSNTSSAIIQEAVLNNGSSFSTDVDVDAGGTLSATLCWTDPPGTPQNGALNSSIPALVNDLDIRITDSSNNIYLPWKLQLSNVAGLAVKGDNLVDNVENIDIEFAQAGSYKITITHKGTLANNSQNYSLIVTGASLTLGVDDFSVTNNLSIWPNPTKDFLNYSFNNTSNSATNISLIDIQGRTIFTKKEHNSNAQTIQDKIDLRNYSKGIYFMIIRSGNSEINKKIIVE